MDGTHAHIMYIIFMFVLRFINLQNKSVKDFYRPGETSPFRLSFSYYRFHPVSPFLITFPPSNPPNLPPLSLSYTHVHSPSGNNYHTIKQKRAQSLTSKGWVDKQTLAQSRKKVCICDLHHCTSSASETRPFTKVRQRVWEGECERESVRGWAWGGEWGCIATKWEHM